MKIAIRADGGRDIGMGHIMRTLVLAKELKMKNDVYFVCRINKSDNEKYAAGIEKIKSEGYEMIIINETSLKSELKLIKADMLITDSYDVNEDYFKNTKKMFKKTCYIDDLNLYDFDVDILINQNFNSEKLVYSASPNTILLLGSHYVLLRNEFRNTDKKVVKETVKDILITVGGSDFSNLTEKIIKTVINTEYNYHIVIGPSFIYENRLKKHESKHINLYFNADMYALMNMCDLAVSGCGSTLYELAAVGVPVLGIVTAKNQGKAAIEMDKAGVIRNLGYYNAIDHSYINIAVDELSRDINLRRNMSLKGQELFDGNGAERICQVINNC